LVCKIILELNFFQNVIDEEIQFLAIPTHILSSLTTGPQKSLKKKFTFFQDWESLWIPVGVFEGFGIWEKGLGSWKSL